MGCGQIEAQKKTSSPREVTVDTVTTAPAGSRLPPPAPRRLVVAPCSAAVRPDACSILLV